MVTRRKVQRIRNRKRAKAKADIVFVGARRAGHKRPLPISE